ncbi:MAG TPA: FAD-binding oxidoreductase [Steroidobacteraceae bacterium]|nr:FAD-binding oxidoreductase [Steroidobacteraceae bacterium]
MSYLPKSDPQSNPATDAPAAQSRPGTDLWRPLWRAHQQRPRPTLVGKVEAEIAIVGGGLEGLSLARELSSRGKRVVLVEAQQLSQGATGASAGIVAPQLIHQSPDDVTKRLGAAQAERFLKLLAGAGKRTFELIGERKRDVGASDAGFIAPVRTTTGARRLAAIVGQWQRFRSDLKLLAADETRALTGAMGYAGALLDPTGGWLNPVAYGELLATDAESTGAVIFLRSAVSSVERAGSRWRLACSGGSVIARQVVLCANGGNAEIAPALRRSILPLHVCQMATLPLDPQVRRTILPQGHAMTDVERDVFSIRFDPQGRLITAYPMSERLREPGRLNELVNRRLGMLLPGFRATPLEHAWTGVAWLNSDLLPRVVRLDDGLFAVQACNGRGIALSTAIGHEFGAWLAGGAKDDCAVAIQKPRAIPGYVFARYLPALLMNATLAARQVRRAVLPRSSTERE